MSKSESFKSAFTPSGRPSARLEKLLQQIDLYAESQEEMAESERAGIPKGDPLRGELHRIAVEVSRLRQIRTKSLPQEYFGEVAWEILLELYIAQEFQKISISTLTSRLNAPMTTVLRWLSHLEFEGRVIHSDHPTDRRIRHVALTDVGRREIDNYFLEFLRSSFFLALK